MPFKVTVGLCIKNSGATVKTALDSIVKQDYPHQDMKLIIVDEEEGTINPYVKDFKSSTNIKTELFLVQSKGLGAARQIVVDNAEGEYIVWIDDDFVLKRDFIRKHVKFMDYNLKVGAALADEIAIKTTIVTIFEGYLQKLGKMNSQSAVMGGFEIFRRNAINQVGGFDVKIKGSAEDRDIAIRIKKAGWLLAINKSAHYYRKYPPTTMIELWRKHFWYGYGTHYLFHKYKSQKARWELFLPAALWIGLRYAMKIYKINREQKAFLLAPYYLFRSTASFGGFFCADLDRYGHK